jgi:hypothetical protein
MAVYTVHQPPLRQGETAPDPDRFVLVRDGFYFWAFLLGPVWMIWRRLWLVFVLYVVMLIGVAFALRYFGANNWVQSLVTFAVMILVGLEAGSLRRWTLARRGWRNVGVVVGDDVESAERRFFASWIDTSAPSAPSKPLPSANMTKPPPPAFRMPSAGSSDIVGLFPKADKSR